MQSGTRQAVDCRVPVPTRRAAEEGVPLRTWGLATNKRGAYAAMKAGLTGWAPPDCDVPARFGSFRRIFHPFWTRFTLRTIEGVPAVLSARGRPRRAGRAQQRRAESFFGGTATCRPARPTGAAAMLHCWAIAGTALFYSFRLVGPLTTSRSAGTPYPLSARTRRRASRPRHRTGRRSARRTSERPEIRAARRRVVALRASTIRIETETVRAVSTRQECARWARLHLATGLSIDYDVARHVGGREHDLVGHRCLTSTNAVRAGRPLRPRRTTDCVAAVC
jgi:hypothetical protein